MADKAVVLESSIKALPDWYRNVFGHLPAEEYEALCQLWFEESALRTLVLCLDHCHSVKTPTCPHCESSQTRYRPGPKQYACASCGQKFTRYAGTPFFQTQPRHYPLVYAVAVLLWSGYNLDQAWRASGASGYASFRSKLKKVRAFMENTVLPPWSSKPTYRLGFTPAEQGLACLRCSSSDVFYLYRVPVNNPTLRCRGCSYTFAQFASRRALLPIPEHIHCPGCKGRQLNRLTQEADGRIRYRCRDCLRHFVDQPKRFHAAKYGPNNVRPVPADLCCPGCGESHIRVRSIPSKGPTIYQCQDCDRQFQLPKSQTLLKASR